MTRNWGYVTDDPQAVAAMNSRRTVRRKVQNATKPFYLLGTETLTAELYLGDQIQREVQTWRIDDSYFYLIDWNQNGSFTDLGVDQIAADKLKAWPPKLQPLKAQNTLQTDRKTVVFSPLEPLALAFDLSPSTDSVDLELISILPDCLHLQNAELDNQLTAALNTSEGLALYFWATWCQPCVKKIKLLETTDYFENGIQYIPICVKSSRSSLEALKAKNEWRFPPFLLADSEADALGIYQIPTTLILDPKKRAITRQ
ncbi:MAG: TlpA disulfide reductase family protein [Bacteroidota bacterium]